MPPPDIRVNMPDMKVSRPELPIPDVSQWTTILGAAEILQLSRRQVERMIGDGILGKYRPRSATGERTPPVLLFVPQVEAMRDARRVAAGRVNA